MDNNQRPPVDPGALRQALNAFSQPVQNPAPPLSEAAIAALRSSLTDNRPATGPASQLAQSPQGTPYMLLEVGQIGLAVPTTNITGVEQIGQIVPLPNTVAWLRGIANLRGAITSVVDFHRLFGLAPVPDSAKSRITVLTARGVAIGFVIDDIRAIVSITDQQINRAAAQSMIPPWLAPYCTGVIANASRAYCVCDVDRFLHADLLQHYVLDT